MDAPHSGPFSARPAPADGGPGLAVVLWRPLIPNNTGNAARTCVATGTPLYLIRPFPFRLEESRLKRAGLDYWPHLSLGVLDDLTPLKASGRLVPITRRGLTSFHDFEFRDGDKLLFGPEDKGLSPELQEAGPSVFVPMFGRVRSLNLSNVVSMVLYQALHRVGRPGGPGNPADPGPTREHREDDRGIRTQG